MSKKTFIHAENNNKILSSNEVRLYVPPEPEKMKVIIWGKELCNGAEWYDFLKCVEEKTRENDQLKQQLAEKQNTINEINKEFVQAVHDWKTLCAEKDKEIEGLKTKQELTFMHSKEDYFQRCNLLEEANIKLQFTQTQLALQELEKVKELLLIESKNNPIIYDVNDDTVGGALDRDKTFEVIDQQINDLRGEKDE